MQIKLKLKLATFPSSILELQKFHLFWFATWNETFLFQGPLLKAKKKREAKFSNYRWKKYWLNFIVGSKVTLRQSKRKDWIHTTFFGELSVLLILSLLYQLIILTLKLILLKSVCCWDWLNSEKIHHKTKKVLVGRL